MTSLLQSLKNKAEQLPPSLGIPLSHVPFAFRLGATYTLQSKAAANFESLSVESARIEIERRLKHILVRAESDVDYYREAFSKAGVSSSDFRRLEDLRHFPIITKTDLANVPIERRLGSNGITTNTGGTSGQPLDFHIDKAAFAREWAHMHKIWYARGYRKEHLKVTLRGKHFRDGEPLRYNAVHNEFVVNSNASMACVCDAILALDSPVIRWIHGYPSLVAELAQEISRRRPDEADRFRSHLYGVLLGSEFPAPIYREAIESHLSANVFSWYGHSEMAVLAGETARGVYTSLPTYGYAEAAPSDSPGVYRLVCTSYSNTAHPFIRYDTGDLIELVSESTGSISFRILDGRIGDFILDRKGRRLALTAIIFGRHHSAFSDISHIQVADLGAGRVQILVTPRQFNTNAETIANGIDFNGLDIDWSVEIRDTPIRTPAGKIKLKVFPT